MTEAALDPPLDPLLRRAVVRQSVSVGLATGAYGVSFGALSVAAGFSIWQTVAMSALLFTGGSQFAIVGIIAAGGSAGPAVAASTLLGVRNGLYSLPVGRLLEVTGLRRVAAAPLTIDESTAVAVAQPEPRAGRLGFWLTGLSVFTLWNLTTLVGALVGDALGDPRRYGLDAAAAGAFCALLWPRLHNHLTRGVALTALTISVVLSALLPAVPMSPLSVVMLVRQLRASRVVSVPAKPP